MSPPAAVGAPGASRLGDLAARLHRTSRGLVEACVVGEGPAVLVLHGMAGSWRQSIQLAEDLVPGHTVIMVSRPGYGRTPLATGPTLELQARAYADLLTALDLGPAAVIGMSAGGPAAAAFAAHAPRSCRGLILCCAAAPHLVKPTASTRLAVLPPVVSLYSAILRARLSRESRDLETAAHAYDAQLTTRELQAIAASPDGPSNLSAFLIRSLQAPPGRPGLAQDVKAIRLGWRAPAERIVAPALVMHGDADTVVPFSHAEYYAGAIATAALDVWPGAGHLFLLGLRGETSARIGAFLHAL
jgi:pimeloyl-ACP methyl ester carboxylesterase